MSLNHGLQFSGQYVRIKISEIYSNPFSHEINMAFCSCE